MVSSERGAQGRVGYSESHIQQARNNCLIKLLSNSEQVKRFVLGNFAFRVNFSDLQCMYLTQSRENKWTEREAQGVGRDMSCPRKLFLDER